VVTSGKGGVGKTMVTANLGVALAELGKLVAMVDMDVGLRNLDIIMGLENRIVYDLNDVIDGQCKLQQALIMDKRFDNLYLLPAAQTRDKSSITSRQMRELCAELKDRFDFVLLDCPAGIEHGFTVSVAGADEAIVVTTPELNAVRDADRVIGLLEAAGHRNPYLIINRVRPRLVRRNQSLRVQEVVDILAVGLLGVIPEDERVVASMNLGEPVVLYGGEVAHAFRDIARRMLGEEVPMLPVEEGRGVLGALRRMMGIG